MTSFRKDSVVYYRSFPTIPSVFFHLNHSYLYIATSQQAERPCTHAIGIPLVQMFQDVVRAITIRIVITAAQTLETLEPQSLGCAQDMKTQTEQRAYSLC